MQPVCPENMIHATIEHGNEEPPAGSAPVKNVRITVNTTLLCLTQCLSGAWIMTFCG